MIGVGVICPLIICIMTETRWLIVQLLPLMGIGVLTHPGSLILRALVKVLVVSLVLMLNTIFEVYTMGPSSNVKCVDCTHWMPGSEHEGFGECALDTTSSPEYPKYGHSLRICRFDFERGRVKCTQCVHFVTEAPGSTIGTCGLYAQHVRYDGLEYSYCEAITPEGDQAYRRWKTDAEIEIKGKSKRICRPNAKYNF